MDIRSFGYFSVVLNIVPIIRDLCALLAWVIVTSSFRGLFCKEVT